MSYIQKIKYLLAAGGELRQISVQSEKVEEYITSYPQGGDTSSPVNQSKYWELVDGNWAESGSTCQYLINLVSVVGYRRLSIWRKWLKTLGRSLS